MKSLAFRFLLLFGLVAILFSAFVLYRAHTVSQRHVRELLHQQMALAMEFNLAIRDYAGGQIRPAMERLVDKDEFHPETMSTSFISRQIFERVRKNFPDCIIRFASDDPRNPINKASPDELVVIEHFRKHPGAKPRIQEIQIEGQRYLAHFTPRWMKAECLRCHGEPKDAPAAMLARYGDTASFHRKVGEIMALDTVAVPLDKMNAALTAETRWQSLILAAGLILLFGAVMVVFRFVVTRRLAAMASHFHEIAAQPEGARLVPLPVRAKDEIGLVGTAFNQLMDHLRDAQTLLEKRVQQRTADLAAANEELRREIAERQRAEQALRESEAQARQSARLMEGLFDAIPDAIGVQDSQRRIVRYNAAGYRFLGLKPEEARGKACYELIGRVKPCEVCATAECLVTKQPAQVEKYVPEAGIWLECRSYPVLDEQGEVAHVIEHLRDISERKRAEESSREQSQFVASLLRAMPVPVFYKDREGKYIGCNEAFTAFMGVTVDEIRGKTVYELWPQELARKYHEMDLELMRQQQHQVYDSQVKDKTGRFCPVIFAKDVYLDKHGEVAGMVGAFLDITERKQAEAALAQAELRVRTMLDNLPEGIVAADVESRRLVFANETFCRMVGCSREEILGALPGSLHPVEHRDSVLLEFERMMRGESQHAADIPVLRKDGSVFPVEINSVHAELDGRACVLATFTDITELKRAEERQEKLQSQLTQAQKMESVGRLAGGVAHDFNNMLQVIAGNVSLALLDLPADSPVRDSLLEVQKSAQRSADLTRQLLAFARKQTIAPKVLDLNDTVAGMLKMLRRLIGEDIDLSWMPGANLWPVKMDPSQLDQVLANLCVNARDAIGGVGTVTIETTNVTLDDTYVQSHPECVPGDYVMLAVSDTGKGMDLETRSHLFEPFFTTKEQGKGTGLGLATVFGIVKQNLGLISVYSEPGQGTTFKIYLPRAEAQEIAATAVAHKKDLRGTETILLVEDEDQILALAQRILQQHGYTVLAARSPEAALKLAEQHAGRIHLLITDVVMPGMNGRELRQRLVALQPELRCLYMSGYTANVIAHHGVLDEGVQFLQKPFTIESLAEQVREALKQALET